jgi:hypothetical protein
MWDTAVVPSNTARLRCEEPVRRLTNRMHAIPPAIAATRPAAIENHVGSTMLDLYYHASILSDEEFEGICNPA